MQQRGNLCVLSSVVDFNDFVVEGPLLPYLVTLVATILMPLCVLSFQTCALQACLIMSSVWRPCFFLQCAGKNTFLPLDSRILSHTEKHKQTGEF